MKHAVRLPSPHFSHLTWHLPLQLVEMAIPPLFLISGIFSHSSSAFSGVSGRNGDELTSNGQGWSLDTNGDDL